MPVLEKRLERKKSPFQSPSGLLEETCRGRKRRRKRLVLAAMTAATMAAGTIWVLGMAFGNDLERQEADPANQGNLLIKGRPQMGEENGKVFQKGSFGN